MKLKKHPCRQWCQVDYSKLDKSRKGGATSTQSRLDRLKLEHLKCPLHVAIENGQLRVVNEMLRRDAHIVEHCDPHGRSPLRLALRNHHKDQVKRHNQKEVARYLMTKQIDCRVKFTIDSNALATGSNDSKSCFIPMKIVYMLKCWMDKAREKVIYAHGIAKSSIPKRKIQARTGLVGNMVLF